ncbi:unnamed protein product [Rodentolepis nana]|uniref:Single-stranded DNA-binding protein, mitochondrial n=1 Tax=Rodentolepis nana TaxID=102285 RepID=A0A0R3TGN0_RODNA|nr:unnamed protein product [Rodentolepis nana]
MFVRAFSLMGRQSILPALRFSSNYSAVFSNDINQITLLGSVASTGVTIDNSSSVATFNLLTRARYRAADRYMMKLVYHRIHVFDRPLVERIRSLSQGDRVYVQGCLSSFKKSTHDWMQCITAQNIILHSDAGKQPLEDAEALVAVSDDLIEGDEIEVTMESI